MADKKPLVAGQSPAVVQQINPADTLDVPEIKLGAPLAAQYGGLGVDASLWASGKIPVFDGSQFAPGDPSGGSLPAGEKDQILVMGASGPEWGGSFPLRFALGQSANASDYATAVGQSANASDYATAVGQYAYAGVGATALGQSATAGDYATALGQSATAGDYATALGQSATAGDGATALGQLANASDGATAVGQSTNAGVVATAIGFQSNATDISIAIGALSYAAYAGSTAIGVTAYAQHERAAVLGAVDENASYQPLTTADRRMTVDYQELEVINQGEGGQTAVILVDEFGGQWRITVNSSGVISASAV